MNYYSLSVQNLPAGALAPALPPPPAEPPEMPRTGAARRAGATQPSLPFDGDDQ